MNIPQHVDILLVEDNLEEARLTIRSFKKSNLANGLFHIDDGADALDFIFSRNAYTNRADDHPPKLILLDLKLPKVSGLQILKEVKGDERTRRIPVIVLTSSTQEP